METWNYRLNRAMRERGFKNKDLVREVGVSAATVTGWTSGEIKKLKAENAEKIARAMKINTKWLITGRGSMNSPELPGPEQYGPGAPDFRMLPVVSSIQAGVWGDAADPYEPGDAHEFAAVIGKYSDSAFVLVVEGESMTASHGLSIPHGSHVIVEPEQEAANGDIVVAKLDYEDKAMIKRLVLDPPRAYLMPLNDKYEKTEINGDCRIVGVVKRFFMDIR